MKVTMFLAIALISIGLASITYALNKTLTIANSGNIHTTGVEAYWDEARTQPIVAIDWGWLSPNQNKTKTLYLFNPGNTAVTLTKTSGNYIPTQIQQYMTLSWSPDLTSLDPKISQATNLTLKVAENVPMIESYTFDIYLKVS